SLLMLRPPPRPSLFPYTTLFRSNDVQDFHLSVADGAPILTNPETYAAPNPSSSATIRFVSVTRALVIVPTYNERDNLPRLVPARSEEHTSELQSRENLVCRLLLE